MTIQSKDKEPHEIKQDFPVNFDNLEAKAKEILPLGNFEYIRGGAGQEQTMRNNRIAFESYAFIPQLLNDTSSIDTSISLFGISFPKPFIFAPVGMNMLEHPDGELAVIRAASKLNIPYALSTVSSYSLEEVAEVAPDHTKFFQLYWSKEEEISFSMISRAEAAGYRAIVLTIDTTVSGWRTGDLKINFSPLSQGFAKGNYVNDPIFRKNLLNGSYENYIDGILKNIDHAHLTWAHIEKIKKHTKLPVLLKGILHPNDAVKALESGIDGLIVSNHGGRQLDGVIGSLDALPNITKVVNGRVPVLFDSGVYSGVDAFKALALGADAVCIGRPYVYGLAIAGEQGVQNVMMNLYNELVTTMTLAGTSSMEELKKVELVKRNNQM
ncbi:alpha-hydroxy acid oxidase [Lysinibacillus yapensis]|nr:alpha-hydroxy acid oxidase [Lysinibacillus yapensis]